MPSEGLSRNGCTSSPTTSASICVRPRLSTADAAFLVRRSTKDVGRAAEGSRPSRRMRPPWRASSRVSRSPSATRHRFVVAASTGCMVWSGRRHGYSFNTAVKENNPWPLHCDTSPFRLRLLSSFTLTDGFCFFFLGFLLQFKNLKVNFSIGNNWTSRRLSTVVGSTNSGRGATRAKKPGKR